MSCNVYLVRHGENEKEREDPGLTELGRKQAEATKLLYKTIDLIFTSPAKRCLQTAEILGRNLHLPYKVSDSLKERISFEEVPDLNYHGYLDLCWKSSNYRDYILPNGDTSEKAGRRLSDFLISKCESLKNGVICVTHQGIIGDFLRNEFSPDLLDSIYKNFDRIREDSITNCSITTVKISDGRFNLVNIGSSLHLSLLHG